MKNLVALVRALSDPVTLVQPSKSLRTDTCAELPASIFSEHSRQLPALTWLPPRHPPFPLSRTPGCLEVAGLPHPLWLRPHNCSSDAREPLLLWPPAFSPAVCHAPPPCCSPVAIRPPSREIQTSGSLSVSEGRACPAEMMRHTNGLDAVSFQVRRCRRGGRAGAGARHARKLTQLLARPPPPSRPGKKEPRRQVGFKNTHWEPRRAGRPAEDWRSD